MKKEIDTKGKERGSTDDDVGVRFSLLIPLRKEKKKNKRTTNKLRVRVIIKTIDKRNDALHVVFRNNLQFTYLVVVILSQEVVPTD